MSAHLILARLCFAVAAVLTASAVWHVFRLVGEERAKERARTPQPIEGYDYAARCECGWEIGADNAEDAALMLALHEIVAWERLMEATS